jgi:hypothetical protein
MALPITPTPVLEGEDAENFIRRLHEDLKTPATLVPTPKIEQARKLVREYARQQQRTEQPKP